MDTQDLFQCCRRGDLQQLQYLVEHKEVDLNVRDAWDSTPLYYACLCGHRELVPIIVEKYKKERNLPHIDKVKFLVPQDLTLSQLSTILRNRLEISSTESFFLFVSGKSLPSLSTSVAELYRDHSDEDGFLYVSYASQEAFG